MLQIIHRDRFSNFEVPPREVWRFLGYSSPDDARPEIREACHNAMEMAPSLLEPAACYDIFPTKDITSSSVEVDGASFDSEDLVLRQREAKELALFINTVGPRVEEEVDRLMQGGDSVLGYMLDMVASMAVATLAYKVRDIIQDHVRSRGYQTLTYAVCIGKKCLWYRDCGGVVVNWWSPGYGDWNTLENKKIFSIVDGTRIGVRVKETGMMTPRKSYACAMPLGPDGKKPSQKCIEGEREWVQRGVKAR